MNSIHVRIVYSKLTMVNAFPSDLPGLLSADAKDQSNAKSENVKLQEQEQFLDLV